MIAHDAIGLGVDNLRGELRVFVVERLVRCVLGVHAKDPVQGHDGIRLEYELLTIAPL